MPNDDQTTKTETEAKPPDGGGFAAPPCSTFNALITELIDEVSNYVYPLIYRTRSTDWVVEIYDHHDPERRKRLAFGQRESLAEALDDAAENYRDMEKREARKEELLKEPLVREALELFKSNSIIEQRAAFYLQMQRVI